MRGLLIEPDGTAAAVTFEADNPEADPADQTHLGAMYRLIGCDTVTVVQGPNETDAWCDDEGLLRRREHNPIASVMCGQRLVGPVLFLGFDNRRFCTAPLIGNDIRRIFDGMLLGPAYTLDEVELSRASGSWWLNGKELQP